MPNFWLVGQVANLGSQMNDGQPRQVRSPVFGDQAAVAVLRSRFGAQQTRRLVAGQDVAPYLFGGSLLQEWEEAALIGGVCSAMRKTYSELLGRPVLVRFSIGDAVKLLLSRPDAEELAACGPLVPDQIVYCRGAPLWMEMPERRTDLRSRVEDLVKARAAGLATPNCLLVDGLNGYLFKFTSPESYFEEFRERGKRILESFTIVARIP